VSSMRGAEKLVADAIHLKSHPAAQLGKRKRPVPRAIARGPACGSCVVYFRLRARSCFCKSAMVVRRASISEHAAWPTTD
jgi:hypothetical protein